MIYPNDATGEALRGLAADGSDMSKPMSIDFSVAAPNERAARAIADAASARGYTVEISPDEDDFDDDEDEYDGEDEESDDEDVIDEEEDDEDHDGQADEESDEQGADEGGADEVTWTCNCRRRMVPSYDAIVAVQAELDALAKPHGGYSDGWGSFGNKADN